MSSTHSMKQGLGLSITSSNINPIVNSQFKHTILWNNILSNLKTQLIENNLQKSQSRLRKQHSRFVAASVGGMLLIKQNIIMNTANTINNLTSNSSSSSSSSTVNTKTISNSPLEQIYFTGSQCIDIVYNYLIQNKEIFQFERQITREKCAKLCQMIMDSGVFESITSRSNPKFDDSSLKYYKFKSDYLKQFDNDNTKLTTENTKDLEKSILNLNLNDKDDNYHHKLDEEALNNKENLQAIPKIIDSNNNTNFTNINTQLNQKVSNSSLLFNKAKLINKTNNVNTKIKRKLTSMKRSSTIHTLLPTEDCLNNENVDISNSRSIMVNSTSLSKPITKTQSTNKSVNKMIKLDRTKSIDSSSYDLKAKFESKSITNKLAQELLLTRQITRELIIEKLLSLIDLPIIEHLLKIDEHNDIEYCQALQRFDNILLSSSCSNMSVSSSSSSLNNQESYTNDLSRLLTKTNLNLIQKSLECLNQTYDLSKCEIKDEWRKSALECLEFINWEKYHLKEKFESDLNDDKNLILLLMKDIELYNLIKDYYLNKQRSNQFFLDDSFQPLFQNILIFIKKSHYNKALEILNLGTLLLLKQTQAALKRLLKFLYLTANSSNAPRLCDEKPNNSIILNHFSTCLINPKLIAFEESRLLLNFMLNNFDNLFRLNKTIEESINKRRLLIQHGKEEAVIEKPFCKRLSSKEYESSSREQTTKALVDLINHIIDDPQISLKHKKLKLKALQRIHPDIYEKYFSDLF